MTEFHPASLKPEIIISDIDYKRLASLATAAQAGLPEVADVLQSELERARVVAADRVPVDVVQMGSAVEFRVDTGQQRRVTLVFPEEENISEGRVSVMTPIGAALIGLSSNQSMTWTTRDGRQHELTVVRAEQPTSRQVVQAS